MKLLIPVAALWFCALQSAAAQNSPGAGIAQTARIDEREGINFASGLSPQRVYVGQQATYEIGIFLSDELRSRLRRNPQFVPPDVRSMIAYDLPVSSRPFVRREGSRVYDVHVFARALFPLTPGVHEIGAARLEYAVPLSSSIFAREESHTARSTPHRLVTLEPPLAGRPVDFSGAVGRLGLGARLDTVSPRVGDPLLLTVAVRGIGNVSLFPRPALSVPWAQAVPGPERVRIDSTSALISGIKEFDWLLTPATAGTHRVPSVRYPYFNPYTESYEVAITQPLDVDVRPGGLAAPVATADTPEELMPIRRTWRGAIGTPLATSPVFWAAVLLAPLPALFSRTRSRGRGIQKVESRSVLLGLAARDEARAAEVRRHSLAVLSRRVSLPWWSLGGDGRRVERALRRAGVTAETASAARALLTQLDEATYSKEPQPAPGLAQRALSVLDAVDAEAKPVQRGRTKRFTWMSLMLWTVGVTTVATAADDIRAMALFTAGVEAWDAGDVARAQRNFANLAAASPRGADAWANTGTASWQLGDTAAAVVGWQRALRLEPVAKDVRQRLVGTPSFRDGLLGDIPPVPVNALAMLALGLWIVGWGLTWSERRGGHIVLTRFAPHLLTAAAVVLVVSLATSERLRGQRQVVVTSQLSLRDAPAVGAETGVTIIQGETGRVLSTQGAWDRVRFSDGRQGWIARTMLESLELSRER